MLRGSCTLPRHRHHTRLVKLSHNLAADSGEGSGEHIDGIVFLDATYLEAHEGGGVAANGFHV